MTDHLDAALHYEALAKAETKPAARELFLATARSFRTLAIEDGRRLVRQMPKRPAAGSVRRTMKRKAAKS